MLIPSKKSSQFGVTLIELMIGVVLVGILLSVAVPSFREWTRNAQIRNAAESVTSGIQRARAEAVARNTDVEFVLLAGTSWVVRAVATPVPALDSRAGSEGSKYVSLVAVANDLTPATTITFNNLGRVRNNADATGSLAQVDFTADGGPRNLRVIIGNGGNAKMCDPHVVTGLSSC